MKAQDYANKFYREYQLMMADKSKWRTMRQELKRWENADDAIYFMPIQEQAEYADYVTKKMCELDEEIFIEFAKSGQRLDKCPTKLESCGIGNQAKIILTFDRYPHQLELKNKLALEFFNYVKRIKAQLKREK